MIEMSVLTPDRRLLYLMILKPASPGYNMKWNRNEQFIAVPFVILTSSLVINQYLTFLCRYYFGETKRLCQISCEQYTG